MLDPRSFLFITLDSCRYDTFMTAHAPNLKSVGAVHRAMAPGNFTFPSHCAMFMGFTPGVPGAREPYVNPKYARIFRMAAAGGKGPGEDFAILRGSNVVDGLHRLGYLTLGAGAVGWFDPRTPTGRMLSRSFSKFYFPGDTYSLGRQLEWINTMLTKNTNPRVFLFVNVGETHVPYYHKGAPWDGSHDPCKPFRDGNDAGECRERQQACLEFVDAELARLLETFQHANVLVCGDHGDAWGEDDMWGHAFHHPKVMEVPLLFRLGESPAPTRAGGPVPISLSERLERRIRRLWHDFGPTHGRRIQS